jgi:allantoinase
MRPVDRLIYAAPEDRKPRAAPDGKTIICWPVVNVENWLIENPMPRQVLVAPTGMALQPDVANWAWHEYGMRVGFWRLLAAFEVRGIRPTLSINGSVCRDYPRVAAAARDAGWDFMGHGFVQVPTHKVVDQAAMIRETVQTIRDFTGKPCLGWLGPGLTETLETPDLLAATGIRYLADFVVDDLPVKIRTSAGTLHSMPYSVELNDIPVQMIQHHAGGEFEARVQRSAARLAREAKSQTSGGGTTRIMSFAIHPYITGVPHRIDGFETLLDALIGRGDIAFMRGCDILDWYLEGGEDG